MLTRLFLASVRANAGRTALSVAGIALGVALGLAVHLINQSAISEMQQASRTLGGDADLTIRAGRESLGGFDENVFATVLAATGVAVASPVLEVDAPPVNADGSGVQRAGQYGKASIKFIGIDVLRAARLQPGFMGEVDKNTNTDSSDDQRFAALQPDNVFINRAARALLEKLAPATNAPTPPTTSALMVITGVERKLHTLRIAGNIELAQYREPLPMNWPLFGCTKRSSPDSYAEYSIDNSRGTRR